MYFFNKIPLFRLTIPLIVGIIIGVYTCDNLISSSILLGFIVFVFLVSFCLLLLAGRTFFKAKWAFGVSLNILLLVAGILLTLVRTERFHSDHISKLDEITRQFELMATKDGIEKPASYKVEAEVISIYENGVEEGVSGKVILYLKKDSLAPAIKYGDVLMVTTSLQQIREAQNPAQFDYKQFLLFHQVTKQAYVSSNSYLVTGVNKGNPLMKWIYELREKMLSILKEHGLEGREFSVGAALILGYTDELDAEIMRSYAGSGALHVLSVSGLHVGILYVVIAFSLSFLSRFKNGNTVKAVILVLFLAGYAMITGLSPSVLRASIMFGFIAIGSAFNRNTTVYNTLAASAILLLVYDPYMIMQVGFQLSYLAVIGIVAIQPLLSQKWQPKTIVMKWVWEISCVSIAAMLVTAPLGLFYFHQLPVYFMLSNLVVIPLSAGILYLGLATLVFSFIPVISGFLASILGWMIRILNFSVEFTEQLPGSVLGGIDITILETVLIYFAILSLFIFFIRRSIAGLYVALTAFLVISVSQFFEAIEQSGQQKLVVYSIKGTSAYDVISGREHLFYAPSTLVGDKNKLLFNVEQNWWRNGLDHKRIIYLDSLQNNSGILYFTVKNKTGIVINKGFDASDAYRGKLKTDFVILSENAGIKVDKVIEYFDPGLVIFDSSNSRKSLEKWSDECNRVGVSYYNVATQGAFVVEL